MLKKGWVIGLMLAGICVSSQSVLGMESKSDKCIITENNTDEIVSFLNEYLISFSTYLFITS